MNNKRILYLTLFLFFSILVILFLNNLIIYIPKIFLLVFFVGLSFVFKQQKKFIKDWVFFLSIIYFSDTLRGLIYFLICKFQFPVYCIYVLNLEKTLFGTVPSVILQKLLLFTREIGWPEKFLTALHGTHFVAFLIVGFYFWIKNDHLFQHFKYSFYILLIFGLSGYLLIPTAPPWMASELFRVIPRLFHFNLHIYNMYIPDLTSGFNTDPVAAMPSLHAAFPFLCSILIWKHIKGKGRIFYVYTFLILFTIVYTGDHYMVDLLAGIVLAIVSFILSSSIQNKQKKQPFFHSYLRIHVHPRIPIIVGFFIIVLSISIGNLIKKPLQKYYQNFATINFIDFTSNPEKVENNFAICLYLGDHYLSQKKYNQAYSLYKKALQLAQTISDKKLIQKKIKFFQLNQRQ